MAEIEGVNHNDKREWLEDEEIIEVALRSVENDYHHTGPRDMYEWEDEVAKKLKLTKVQYDFVQRYLATGKATQAFREAKGEVTDLDYQKANAMKNTTRINMYIQETAMECAEIQFNQIIKNEKAPMAVRNDAIKDRLNRAGVWVEKDEDKGNMFVGNMTITIDK